MNGSGQYYHKDCFELKKKKEKKDEQTKEDLKQFRELWYERIDRTVVWWKLNKVVEEYLERGIPSDYILFALKYVIVKGFKLRYPEGFRYYLDRQEIKDAYKEKKRKEKIKEQIEKNENTTNDKPEVVVPFKVPKRKKLGDLFK